MSAMNPKPRNAAIKPNIIMIAPTPFYSGRGTHMRILYEADALAKRGHQITITTYHIGDDPNDLHAGIKIRRIRRLLFWYTQRAPGPNWQKLLLDILLFLKTLRFTLREKPEILHGHLHEGVLIGWMVKKLLFFRKIILAGDFHGPLVGEMRSHGYLRFALLQKIFTFMESFIHRLPDIALASSPGLKFKIDADRQTEDVHVLSDAPTLTYLAETAPAQTSIPSYPCQRDSELPCVAYTGGFTPDKGIDLLFEVIRHASQNGLACRWIIAGGPIDQLFIPDDIKHFIQVISPLDHDNLAGLLQHGDVACDPKRGDTLQSSGKLLNYMYAGLPPVCFDGPAQRFYLGDELAGRLIAKDVSHFYEIIKNLLEMPADEKTRLKAMIQQRAQQFTWDKSVRMLEQYYLKRI
jgi:glycosyltransferase involved in cell wall biosynthesis